MLTFKVRILQGIPRAMQSNLIISWLSKVRPQEAVSQAKELRSSCELIDDGCAAGFTSLARILLAVTS